MRLPASLLLTATCALALGACGSPGSPGSASTAASTSTAAPAAPSTGAIPVALKEWSVAPKVATAKAGKVTFTATNAGKVPHELVVLRTSRPAGSLGKGARISEAGNVGETGDVAPGATKSVSLKLKPGHYALVCNIAGHYSSGMHSDFVVR